jgi:hypothetical protein
VEPAAAAIPTPPPSAPAVLAGLWREPSVRGAVLGFWALLAALSCGFYGLNLVQAGVPARDALPLAAGMGSTDSAGWILTYLAGVSVAAVVPLHRRRWLPGALAIAAAALALPPLRFAAVSELWVRLGWSDRLPLLPAAVELLPGHFLLVGASIGAGYGLLHAARQREGERALARREAELAHARFQAVRSRVPPELLFAALAGIGALAHGDPQGADRLLLRVSRVLRNAFRGDAGGDLPLEDELEQVRLHAEFAGGGSAVREDVAAGALAARIPRMAVFPVVADALRHAAPSAEVRLRARIEDGELRLEVRDPGARPLAERRALPGWEEVEVVSGLLADRFGAGTGWRYADLPGGGVLAALSLPHSTAARPRDAAPGEP